MKTFEGVDFCAVKLEQVRGICRWPKSAVTWTVTGSVPGFSDIDLKLVYGDQWAKWAAVCGLQPSYTANARTAGVLMGSGYIDGPAGTLAWSELPCGRNVRQLQQRYDTGDLFVYSDSPVAGKIDLGRVALHEIGHAIGIPHIAAGNIMQPSFTWSLSGLQADDVREAVRRYASPKPQPTPAPGNGNGSIDPMTPEQREILKARILSVIGFLESLAKWTPTPIDDQLLALSRSAAEGDWLVDLIDFIGTKFGPEPTAAQLQEGAALYFAGKVA